jgi:hypothetical protein
MEQCPQQTQDDENYHQEMITSLIAGNEDLREENSNQYLAINQLNNDVKTLTTTNLENQKQNESQNNETQELFEEKEKPKQTLFESTSEKGEQKAKNLKRKRKNLENKSLQPIQKLKE